MATLRSNTIFTNVALTLKNGKPDGGVWWEGMTPDPPAECLDWRGNYWTPELRQGDWRPRRAPKQQVHRACITMSPPSIRRGKTPTAFPFPPSSSAAAAAAHDPPRLPVVQLVGRRLHRRDHGLRDHGRRRRRARQGPAAIPMAMLPFCGYHMGDYFRHLAQDAALALDHAAHLPCQLVPARREWQSSCWPGYSQNMRVLKWIVDRAHGRALGKETPIGWTPHCEGHPLEEEPRLPPCDLRGTTAGRPHRMETHEVMDHEELFLALHDHLPPEMIYERELLICRL